jgi:hypothetical protein
MKKLLLTFLCDITLLTSLIYFLLNKYEDRSYNQYYRITYFVPKENKAKYSEVSYFNAPNILEENAKKKFIPISLTGNHDEDEKRFEFIQWKARELKYTNDTSHILKVHLPESLKYGQFIRLLNLMLQDQHKRYFEHNNNFYIFGEPSGTEIESVNL